MFHGLGRRCACAVVAATLCVSLAWAGDAKPSSTGRKAQERRQAISQCESAIDAGKHKQAEEVLLRLRRQAGDERDPVVEALLARCFLARDKQDEAWKLVSPYVAERSGYKPALDSVYFAAADVLTSKKDHEGAAGLMDWVATHSEGRTLVTAAERCGQAYAKLGENKKAARSFEFAIKYAKQNLYDDGTLKPLFDRLNKQLREVRDPLEEEKRQKEIEKLGEDFYLFREAETLRRKSGEHKAAFEAYGNKKWGFVFESSSYEVKWGVRSNGRADCQRSSGKSIPVGEGHASCKHRSTEESASQSRFNSRRYWRCAPCVLLVGDPDSQT